MADQAPDTRLRLGVLAILGAAFCTSLSGILIRIVDQADGWQILFWRSASCAGALLLFTIWRHGARAGDAFIRIGGAGAGVVIALTGAFSCFIFAMLHTTVANVAFTVGLAPVFAALLAWLLLREAIGLRTAVFIALSLIGMALMFGDGVLTGSLAGNVLALLTALFFAAAIVLLRGGRSVDMIPAVILAALVSAVLAVFIAPAGITVGGRDLMILFLMGAVQLALQYILFTYGIRHLPAAQAALISRLSVVLTPLWAWLGVGEIPSLLTLAGGGFVLAAVAGQGLSALWATRTRV
ncbi:MAG: DMT family transporter [Rhodospirillales bacterium]|nr:MAG: DMT family transporter [Rhodospirillales bacterium]